MKRNVLAVLIVMALAFAVNANAQIKAQADVPFSFSVGEKALPAGSYQVKDAAMNVVLVQSAHGSDTAMIQCHSAEKLEAQSPKLVFHKYGDRYFLYQIWTSGNKTGMELRESKYEKEAQLAINQGSAPQEVVVALR
jgi:hypothetical protein